MIRHGDLQNALAVAHVGISELIALLRELRSHFRAALGAFSVISSQRSCTQGIATMAAVPVMPAIAAQGHTGTDFGQDLTKKEEEIFVAGPDAYDGELAPSSATCS